MKTMTNTEKNRPATTDGGPAQRGYVSPRVNITETKDGYLLEAEMPGVRKEDLEISLDNNELTLLGRRQPEPQGFDLLYRESNGLSYRRSFALDLTIDTGKIEAKMDNGVLKLHLPKAEQVKPRKIAITGQ